MKSSIVTAAKIFSLGLLSTSVLLYLAGGFRKLEYHRRKATGAVTTLRLLRVRGASNILVLPN